MWELPGGMAQLPEALAQAVRDLGGGIELHHRLSGVELGATAVVPSTLRFETKNGGHRSITASRVILALPPGALARVEGLADRAEFRSLAAELAPQRAVTTALIYRDAWWRTAGVAAGYSVTDQPARHIRHYGSEAWRKPGPGALLSYSDGGFADFWTKLADGGGGFGWIGPEHPIVRELHRQAAAMFEARRDVQPTPPAAGFSHDWANDLSGAAFHLWQAGSEPERTTVEALDPLPGRPLHICGEAWSTRQGWMEGALETVAMLLECLPEKQAAPR
jgi:monoamine oxidase